MALFLALKSAYNWSLSRPQAIGYGFVLVGMAQFRMGDLIMLLFGLVAIVGGIIGAWRYVMKSDE